MSKVKELRARAMKIHGQAQSLIADMDKDGVTDERRAELRGQFNQAMAEFDAIKAQADDLERLDAAGAAVEEMRASADRQGREERRATGGALEGRSEGAAGGNAEAEYRSAFQSLLMAGGVVSDLPAETRALLRGGYEARATNQSGATLPGGGYAIPTTLASELVKALALWGPMFDEDFCTVLKTPNGAPMLIPGLDDTESEAEDHAEGDDLADAESGISLIKTQLQAYTSVTPWLSWSFELGQDSAFAWEALLAELLAERQGRKINRMLTKGTGTGQALGVMTAAPVGRTASSQTAITFDDLIKLEHSIDPAYRVAPKFGFMVHDKTVESLRLIKNTDGKYVWNDGDVTKGVPATLLGRKAKINQAVDEIGAGKSPVACGNFGKYMVRQAGVPLIGVDPNRKFPNLSIANVMRYDGALADPRAIKRLKMAG